MRIIKKVAGYRPEIMDLSKDEVSGIFHSGMDKQVFFKSLYIISRYQQQEKTEKTFNTSILFPHMNITHYHNDVYVIKKGLLRFSSLNDSEIEEVMKLFKYDSERAKDPVEEKKPQVVTKPTENEESNEAPTIEDIDAKEEATEDIVEEDISKNSEEE